MKTATETLIAALDKVRAADFTPNEYEALKGAAASLRRWQGFPGLALTPAEFDLTLREFARRA